MNPDSAKIFCASFQAAFAQAEYEAIDDGEYCATVPDLRGVIGTGIGKTIEECRADLIEAIEGWIALRQRLGMAIPSKGEN